MSLADFVNDRDVLLRNTSPRNISPRAGKYPFLQAVPPVFHVSAAGVASPDHITLTATFFGIPGAVTWTIDGGALTGAADNVRSLAFADVTAPVVTVTAQIAYQGEIYTAQQVIQRVVDGSAANVTSDTVLQVLAGQLTVDQLEAALRARISLIDDPATTPGSVQARVKAETDARVAAITQEATDRTTYVQNYTYSKAQSDESLSVFATTITSAYKSYADGVGAATLSAAEADVRTYGYSKSTTDSAIAASAESLRTEFNSSAGASESYVQNWAYSKSQIDTAEAAQSSSLTTAYQGYATARRDEAISAASADVRNYAYSKSAIDGAFSSQSSAISAAYTNAVTDAAADVRSYSYAKATVDSAITSSTNAINSRLNNAGGTGVSVEAKMTATANAVTGLNAQYTIKLDVNGYVAGIGVANDGASSPMIISASALKMVAPGTAPGSAGIEMFDVTTIGSTPTARFNGVIIMKSAASGARVETDKDGMRAYDGVQALPRVEVGLLS